MGVLKCPALDVYEYVMPKKPKHTYKFGITPLANEEKKRVKKSTQLFIANYQSSLSHKPPKTCRRLQTLYFLSHSSGQLSLEVAMFVCLFPADQHLKLNCQSFTLGTDFNHLNFLALAIFQTGTLCARKFSK